MGGDCSPQACAATLRSNQTRGLGRQRAVQRVGAVGSCAPWQCRGHRYLPRRCPSSPYLRSADADRPAAVVRWSAPRCWPHAWPGRRWPTCRKPGSWWPRAATRRPTSCCSRSRRPAATMRPSSCCWAKPRCAPPGPRKRRPPSSARWHCSPIRWRPTWAWAGPSWRKVNMPAPRSSSRPCCASTTCRRTWNRRPRSMPRRRAPIAKAGGC